MIFINKQALFWLLLTIGATSNMKLARNNLSIFILVAISLLFIQFIPMINYLLKKNAFIWLFEFLFIKNSKRVSLKYVTAFVSFFTVEL